MPYLTEDRKARLDEGRCEPETVADLDYVLAKEANSFIERHGIRFDTYAKVIAALETTKLEIARRFAWYEQEKCKQNGDVLRSFDKL